MIELQGRTIPMGCGKSEAPSLGWISKRECTLALFSHCQHLVPYRSVENGTKMCQDLGLEYFRTVDVHHRCRAYGCSFKHQDGWSITSVPFFYTGDILVTLNQIFGRHHAYE